MIGNSLFGYYLNSYWSGKMIGYGIKEQIADILPSFFLAITMGLMVFLTGRIIQAPDYLVLIIQLVMGALLTIGLAEMFRLDAYVYLKTTAREKLNDFRKRG
ncbi:MAG: hypothetical protein ACP5DQ_07770 [Bacteroidales bacterium]